VNGGVLGVPISGPLRNVSNRVTTRRDSGHELTTAVDVVEQHTLDGETAAVEGRVLRESVEEQEAVTVEDGSIRVGSERRTVQRWADFAGITARDDHEGFLVVNSSDSTFAYDVVGDAILEAAAIDLAGFVDEHEVLQVSTAGSPALGPVDSLTAHGSNVLEDEEIGVGEHIRDSIRAGTLSQVRVRYRSDHGPIRGYLAASGYVEIYEPDLETPEFLSLVADDILPFASGGDSA
jgi:hypothetical protein